MSKISFAGVLLLTACLFLPHTSLAKIECSSAINPEESVTGEFYKTADFVDERAAIMAHDSEFNSNMYTKVIYDRATDTFSVLILQRRADALKTRGDKDDSYINQDNIFIIPREKLRRGLFDADTIEYMKQSFNIDLDPKGASVPRQHDLKQDAFNTAMESIIAIGKRRVSEENSGKISIAVYYLADETLELEIEAKHRLLVFSGIH